VGNSVIAGFKIPKIGDVCGCSTATSDPIIKWMVPGHSAHWVGPVRHPLGLADCSESISMWGIVSLRRSEFRKFVMFVAVAGQPVIQS